MHLRTWPILFLLLMMTACERRKFSGTPTPPPEASSPGAETAATKKQKNSPAAPAPAPAKRALDELAQDEASVLALAKDARKVLNEEEAAGALSGDEAKRLRSLLQPDATAKQLVNGLSNLSRIKRSERMDAALTDLHIATETYLERLPKLSQAAADEALKKARADWLARAPRETLVAHADALLELRSLISFRTAQKERMSDLSAKLNSTAAFLRESAELVEGRRKGQAKATRGSMRHDQDSVLTGFVSRAEVQQFKDEMRGQFVKALRDSVEELRRLLLEKAPAGEIEEARQRVLNAAEEMGVAYSGEGRPEVQYQRLETFARFWNRANTEEITSEFSEPVSSMDRFAEEFKSKEPKLAEMAAEKAASIRARLGAEKEKMISNSAERIVSLLEGVKDQDSARAVEEQLAKDKRVQGDVIHLRNAVRMMAEAYGNPLGASLNFLGETPTQSPLETKVAPAMGAAKERAGRHALSARLGHTKLQEAPWSEKPLKEGLLQMVEVAAAAKDWKQMAELLEPVKTLSTRGDPVIAKRLQGAKLLAQGERFEKVKDDIGAVMVYRMVIQIEAEKPMVDFATARMEEIGKTNPDALKADPQTRRRPGELR